MFDIGFWELAIIGLVALIVIGPERLPSVARTVGLWMGRGRRILSNLKSEIDREIKADEMKKAMEETMANPLSEAIGETASAVQDIKHDTEKVMDKARSQLDGKDSEQRSPAPSDEAHDKS